MKMSNGKFNEKNMNRKISILQNEKILVYDMNPYADYGQATFISKIRPNIKSWLDDNCSGYVQIIKESVMPGDYEEITHLLFEKYDDATLFKMVWL